MRIPELSSSAAERKPHPFLFATPAQLQEARKRVRSDRSLRKTGAALVAEAEKDLELQLKELDRSWINEAKSKPWQETYPVVYQKTYLEPAKMAGPMEGLAYAWVLTGDERFKEKARAILLHLSDYTFEFEHYDAGMNYSVWGYRALRAYDLLFERFTREERARLDAFFTRMGRAVLTNDVYWVENRIGGGINNHLAWHKMMLGMVGAFYGHESLIEYALQGPRGIRELLELGLVDDGLWCESSLNYHFTAIVPMTFFADVLRTIGYPEDLFHTVFADGKTLKQPFDAMLGVLFPDRTIPPVGDAYGRWANLADQALYEHAYVAYGDPRYAWLLTRAKERNRTAILTALRLGPAEVPDIRSRLFPEHGYAFLRSRSGKDYWESDAWCAFLTYDRSGVHSNADKLSLMLFGSGKLLVPDVEARATVPHAFSSRVQRELNRGALSQNTVMIDGRDQRGNRDLLTLIEYRDLADEKRVTAADLKGVLYPGVRQQRTIAVTEGYVLDVFQVVADATADIEWILHGPKGSGAERSSLSLGAVPARTEGAWEWIRDFRGAGTEKSWWIQWSADKVDFRVTMLGAASTQVTLCGYPETDEAECAVFPMLVVGRRGERTSFVTLYQAGRSRLPEMDIRVGEEYEGRCAIAVEGGGRSRRHLIPVLR